MRYVTNSKLISLPFECKKVILLNALFQGGRLFVGAVCVLYFLSFGLQTEDYAWIKTTQAVVFIGLDIPLGYFLNKIGEYKSLIFSLILGIIGASGYLISTSFTAFLASEIFLALSLSVWPVALSAYSMRVLEKYKIDGLTEKFFHFGDSVSNFFVLVCGALGGFLYGYNKYFPYSFFLIFYLAAAIYTIFNFNKFEVQKTENSKNNQTFNLESIKLILPYAFILFFVQFFMQPLFHYWQPLFQEKFSLNSKDFSFIFIAYSIGMSSMSWDIQELPICWFCVQLCLLSAQHLLLV